MSASVGRQYSAAACVWLLLVALLAVSTEFRIATITTVSAVSTIAACSTEASTASTPIAAALLMLLSLQEWLLQLTDAADPSTGELLPTVTTSTSNSNSSSSDSSSSDDAKAVAAAMPTVMSLPCGADMDKATR
jgi:hypothetical protein